LFITGAIIPVDGGQTLNGWKSSIGDAGTSGSDSVDALSGLRE